MKLTCITATFNCIKAGNRERLIRCVESVAKLKTEHEHLIYDGASKDGTVELLRELEVKTPGLKVVSEPDTGIYNALNKGVRDAKGEWFYVLGADDYIENPEVMDSLVIREDESTKVIVAPIERDGMTPYFTSLSDLKKILWTVVYSHQGVIAKTSAMREFGGFDEQYKIVADGDLFFKMHNAAVKFHYTFTPFANFFLGGLCMSDWHNTREEVSRMMAKHLHVTEQNRKSSEERVCWPLRKILPYLFHRDYALRISARYYVTVCLKRMLRFIFYPAVVLTRLIRHKNNSVREVKA